MPTFRESRYETTQYRRSGRNGLMLPAISLGAWETFRGYRDEDVARDCLFGAFDLGITHFDLANNCGTPPGNAEIVCARIIKEMPRDELIISSKAGYYMWAGPYGEWGSKKYLPSIRSKKTWRHSTTWSFRKKNSTKSTAFSLLDDGVWNQRD